MELLIQPGDGIRPLVRGIEGARKSIEILIFRFDRSEIERALDNAVQRGVTVHALIAYTNRGGEKSLRKLEMRLLAKGVTVSRTNNDLTRYHGKILIIDRRVLYLLAFNFTYLDIEHSRSFGIVTRQRELVQEAVRLFEADSQRRPYQPHNKALVVSPLNARQQLTAFIKAAKRQLLIYCPEIRDPAMIRLLEERAAAGVDLKVIGSLIKRNGKVTAQRPPIRLHTRTILRDGTWVFLGSQGLRESELDERREIGVIFRHAAIAAKIAQVFEADWAPVTAKSTEEADEKAPPVAKVAKRVAKELVKDLPSVAPVIQQVLNEVGAGENGLELNHKELDSAVQDVVKQAVKDVVKTAVQEAVDQREVDMREVVPK